MYKHNLLCFSLLPINQGDEAREGACRALARPGGAPGTPDADAYRGCQEPAQPPGARRERGPADPFVPADGSLWPARAKAQRGLFLLLRRWGERHLGATPHVLDNTGVRGQGEDMRLMVKMLGEVRQERCKTDLFILYHWGGGFLWKSVQTQWSEVKTVPFFWQSCVKLVHFLLYTHHVADQKMNIVQKCWLSF